MSYATWLADTNAHRCILAEVVASVSGVETTLYWSSAGYTTSAADTPANTSYLPLIAGGVQISEEINLDGAPSLSYGDIELFNISGAIDNYLDYVWVNRSVKVYIGDLSWSRSAFQIIFDGVIADIGSSSRDRLNIKIRDKFQRLNSPISDVKLGGTTPNADVIVPLTFGECFNVTPLLSNPATHEYTVHTGAIESIIEVRDNGVPVAGFTPSLATGKFTLTTSPAGTITASIQGDKPTTYANTISIIAQRLATGFGKSSTRFVTADIDTTQLSAFEAAHTQTVGLYISDRTNVIDAIQQLANSIGAQSVISREGKLQILQIALPPIDTPYSVGKADMVESSLAIEQRIDVKSSVKIGFCKNWTLQNNLNTGIPEAHKVIFSTEFLTKTATNSTTATNYKLDADPSQKDSLLCVGSEASAEASRDLAIYSTPRTLYMFEGFAPLFILKLGQAVTITHPRFGLSAGKTGVVTKLQPDWLTFRIRVGVLI